MRPSEEAQGEPGSLEPRVEGPEGWCPDGFVGRRRELARLFAALDGADGGHGAVVTLCGEPGIGKSRLLAELGRYAERRDVCVLVGRCYETSDAPALWPWEQVLASYLETAEARTMDAELRRYAAPIAEILPNFRHHLNVPSGLAQLEPSRARFRIFDSIARLLAATSRVRPLLIVLEDLHAADGASLRLLEFVAHECRAARVLIVASYRDLEVDESGELARTLAALSGATRLDEIRLAGLDADESRRLIDLTAAGAIPEAVARAVAGRCDGHPLFLLELLRNVLDDATADPAVTLRGAGELPLSVTALVGRRLDLVSAACARTLTYAAAIGREFDVRELELVTGLDRVELLAHLDEAGRRRIIGERSDLGRYWFTHALVRECLYERLGIGERSRLHRRIARALETFHGDEIERHLPAIADHMVRGVLAGGAREAIDYTCRAGRAATATHAYDEAARHYERALSVWRLDERRDPGEHCDLLIELGTAEQSAGHPEKARTRFEAAVALARTLRNQPDHRAPRLLARAALGLGYIWGDVGIFDQPLVDLLEEAAAALEPDDRLRCRLLARASVAYYWTDASPRRDALSAEAVAIARRIGDEDTLGFALAARHFAIWGLDRREERLALAEEALQLGERRRDGELALSGRYWRFLDHLQAGDTESAHRDHREYARRADEIRHPYFLANATLPEAMFATLEGRLDEAELLVARAYELGQRANSLNAQQYFGIQTLMLARLRGTEHVVVDAARSFVERIRGIPAWRAALASLYAALGKEPEARREVEYFAATGLATLPHDANITVALALLTEACVFLEERTLSRRLYDLLKPYAPLSIIIANGVGHLGVVSHYLGLLTATSGQADRADAWFADALGRYEAMGARPFVVRVLLDRAGSAFRSRATVRAMGPIDPVRAMVERALAIAREVGMPGSVATAERLLEELGPAVNAGEPGAAETSDGACVWRCEGAYWTVAYAGVVARIKDAKGLHYLHALLRSPARDLHALDLLGGAIGDETNRHLGNRSAPDAGPVLDERAKMAYRARLRELRGEIEAAEAASDLGRTERARTELDYLNHHLSLALGLGGRDRRALAVGERARLNVTRAIRAVIRRIAIVHPALASHLDASVVTGLLCRYEPTGTAPVDWRL